MQEPHLYEYAVIRIVPKVERDEFVNVGVIVFCKKAKFIKVLYAVNSEKLKIFSTDCAVDDFEANLLAFQKIGVGSDDGGPISQLDAPSRFRWLTAVRSSVIQTSRPHPGLSFDLDKTLERLFEELVL